MAAIRQKAVVHFHVERRVVYTADISSLAWELLTQGFTPQLLKQAIGSMYRRTIRPVFTDEDVELIEDKHFLAMRNLLSATYLCKLRVGEEDKTEDPKQSKKSRSSRHSENKEPVSELHLNIFKVPVDKRRGRAGAFSITESDLGDMGDLDHRDVHVKWGTTLEGLKLLYHEAEVYDHLREKGVVVTPKFYGYYEKYAGTDTFATSVFERSGVFPSPKCRNDMVLIIAKFVRAVQELHKGGICHGHLLTGNRETGFGMTDNVRITKKGNIRLVNFERAMKHKGHGCPSAESGPDLEQRGCQELDDIYEFFKPWSQQLSDSDSVPGLERLESEEDMMRKPWLTNINSLS